MTLTFEVLVFVIGLETSAAVLLQTKVEIFGAWINLQLQPRTICASGGIQFCKTSDSLFVGWPIYLEMTKTLLFYKSKDRYKLSYVKLKT